MKLYFSAVSPFARKVRVVALELGIADRIELVPAHPNPVDPDPNLLAHNPLGQAPVLVTAEGQAIYDSPVICEYLDRRHGGGLVPADGPARWRALTEEALGDGLLAAAVLVRYEARFRPADKAWAGWTDAQRAKVDAALRAIEANADSYPGRVDIGAITLGCALGYLDFRFPELAWRERHPATAAWSDVFGARPSMAATRPSE